MIVVTIMKIMKVFVPKSLELYSNIISFLSSHYLPVENNSLSYITDFKYVSRYITKSNIIA